MMGGKPSKGTPADRRLKANQPPAAMKPMKGMTPMPAMRPAKPAAPKRGGRRS